MLGAVYVTDWWLNFGLFNWIEEIVSGDMHTCYYLKAGDSWGIRRHVTKADRSWCPSLSREREKEERRHASCSFPIVSF